MKLYDSTNYPVIAVAAGAVVTLTTQAQGTPTPNRSVSQAGGRIAVSNPTLEFSGRSLTGMVSVLTLSSVIATNSLTIGSKTYTAGTEFAVGGTDAITAANLVAAINAPILETQPLWAFNYENLNLDVKVSGTGAVSASVDVEQSLNGIDWTVLVTLAPTGTTSAALSSLQIKPKPFLRVKPAALTGTGARLQVSASPA